MSEKMISAENLLPPQVVYAFYKGLIREWPSKIKSMPLEIINNPKKIGNEFEDFVYGKIPRGIYRTWKGRGKPLHGKSCVPNEHDIIIYRWERREFPIIIECKTKRDYYVEVDDIRAFNAKVLDIYYTYEVEYSESLKVKFSDIYRVFITDTEVTEKAIFYALAYGILLISPYRPNPAVAIYKFNRLPRKRLKDLKQQNFYDHLLKLYNLSFRGFRQSIKEVLSGSYIYAMLKSAHDTVQTLTGRDYV